MKVCLDPGHGGNDPGAVNGSRYEKDDVLKLALAVKPLLEAQGIGVIMTRETDVAIPIVQRCALANQENCSYYLSLHRDAAGASAYGISAWVHSRATEDTLQKAQMIVDEVLGVTPTMNRRVNKGTPQNYTDFGVNVQTTMASALIELGFVTNADDNERFDTCFDRYVSAIAKALCKICGKEFAEIPQEQVQEINYLYEVYEQSDVFEKIQDARDYAAARSKETMIVCRKATT